LHKVNIESLPKDIAEKALEEAKTSTSTPNDDGFGIAYIQGIDHLKEAGKFLVPMLKAGTNDVIVLELACKVYLAKSKSCANGSKVFIGP
jgi:hypothetical protein